MRIWENRIACLFLTPFSGIYRAVTGLRNRLYDRRLLRIHRLPVRVISVGNVTVGGTGKTPLVEWIARYCLEHGSRVAVLTRGYRRKEKPPFVLSPENRSEPDPETAGDEPALLARRLPEVTVVVDSDRVQAGRTAIRTEGADTLILDDGFQHRRLARDLELLVMDASNPWGNGRLLPAGPLREGLPALKRAHAVLLTRVNESEQTEDVIQTLRHYTQVPVLTSVHRPCGWVDLSGRTYPVSHLQRKRAFAFCGIGNPGSFYKTLQELGVNITAFEIFPDHFWYAQRDRDRLWARAKASGAEALVMTEKDSVRMGPGPVDELPAYALQIELAMGKDEERMRKLLQDVLGS